MEASKKINEKLVEFIQKEKFIEKDFYPGTANERMLAIFTKKINQAAKDFKDISGLVIPTEAEYQEKIRVGLLRFADVYLELDTEDREKFCSYFEELMDIVEIESSNGQLNKFLYGFDIE